MSNATNMKETVVRLYEDKGGTLEFCDVEFELADLHGHLPLVGDTIVDPGVIERSDRNDPTRRRLYQVLGRYLAPRSRTDGFNYVCLKVQIRNGQKGEEGALQG